MTLLPPYFRYFWERTLGYAPNNKSHPVETSLTDQKRQIGQENSNSL